MPESTEDPKSRNAEFVERGILPVITRWDALLPVGQLIVLFHGANSIGLEWGTADFAEKRNHRLLKAIRPSFQDTYIQAFVSGSFKPDRFIHPFEDSYFTSTGFTDVNILPEFFQTTDHLARSWPDVVDMAPQHFLAYVYLYFLSIHPFVDGNGRVARNLLDYYNERLSLGLQPVWRAAFPKFAHEAYHKQAFALLFEEDLGLPKHSYTDKYSHREMESIADSRAVELDTFEHKAIANLKEIRTKRKIVSAAILTLADGMIGQSA